MKKNQKEIVSFMSVCLVLLLFVGCSGLGMSTADQHALLKQRLDSYIAARKKSDFKQLRQLYLEPEKVHRSTVIIKDSKVVAIEISADGQKAATRLENQIQIMGFTFEKVPNTVNWVWNENNWFIEIKDTSAYPLVQKIQLQPSGKTSNAVKERK